MYDDQNIFARILRKELPCKKIYEDDEVLAFHDAFPMAPIHVLVIPKGKFTSFADFVASSADVGSFFSKVADVARILEVEKTGYRVVTNHGSGAGQTVKHFHVHILAGKELGSFA
ncbi:HIT domain protein [Neorickettsia helminthoeca str. Oregon]|uniref:HIT domain protein n=1 Tax=Neorickettsia helminthoeca str. Oregon TaxID=1286528 RepID=X5GW96_9RICK|nr:histidine triad nucleotide-binding protein [Neorickettsia helminthoeca]AHX11342.1 HIT domain protein [Neorickettsia helminthoeca str. Oregon]